MSHNTAAQPNFAPRTIDRFPYSTGKLAALAVAASILTGCGPATEAQPSPTVAPTTAQYHNGPHIALPFAEAQGKNAVITQGDKIAPDDAFVLGADASHGAIDIEGVPCGSDILAPHDGIAITGYQLVNIRGGAPFNPDNPSDDKTNFRIASTGQEGPVFATGLFTEVIAATKNEKGEVIAGVPAPSGGYRSTLMVHMGSVAQNIVRTETRENGTVTNGSETIQLWHPTGVVKPQGDLLAMGTPVKKGDRLGSVGNSAIGLTGDGFNKQEFMNSYGKREFALNLHKTPGDMPWDPLDASVEQGNICQTHMSVSGARDTTTPKLPRLDHIDILDNPAVITGFEGDPDYHNPISQPGRVVVGPKALLMVHPDGRFVFADQQ